MRDILSFLFEKLSPFHVWIMVGLPGSGKSTWINENLPDGINIVNQDSIRVELGIMKNVNQKRIGDKEQEKEVSRINDERIEKFIKERQDFVIDNTNVKAGRVENYYKKLIKAGADVKIVIIDTPVATCIQRRKDDIPKSVIEQMDLGVQKVKKQFGKDKNTIIVKNDKS